MNQIKLVTGLPNWQWKEHSQKEIVMTGEELVEDSDFVWRIGEVAVIGFIYSSYLAPPWMWFVLAEKIGIADLVDFRRLSRLIPKGTLTAIAADYSVGHRFAKLYNFVETDENLDYSGNPYKIWRKV